MKAVAVFPGKPGTVHLADLGNDMTTDDTYFEHGINLVNANREYFEMGAVKGFCEVASL